MKPVSQVADGYRLVAHPSGSPSRPPPLSSPAFLRLFLPSRPFAPPTSNGAFQQRFVCIRRRLYSACYHFPPGETLRPLSTVAARTNDDFDTHLSFAWPAQSTTASRASTPPFWSTRTGRQPSANRRNSSRKLLDLRRSCPDEDSRTASLVASVRPPLVRSDRLECSLQVSSGCRRRCCHACASSDADINVARREVKLISFATR
ncbi:hypothetical protein BJY59DRAFT_541318 [Rhodotorula toruloides]